MDDFTIYGVTFEDSRENLEIVLKRCHNYNLSLRNGKCFMMMEEGVVLGHFISSKGIQVDPTKIKVINTLLTLEKQKDVHSFLAHVGYYRRFIKNFSQLVAPLYNLLKKNSKFVWDTNYVVSFLQLKEVLTTMPILRGPNWGLPFHIHMDASDYAIGVVLEQKLDSIEHVIYFISKNFQGGKFNYTVTKKELLAIIYALK